MDIKAAKSLRRKMERKWRKSKLVVHKEIFQQQCKCMCVNGKSSKPRSLLFGMPQGSVVGPFGFTCYSTPLRSICRRHSAAYYLYADDTQIYASFSLDEQSEVSTKVELCISEIREWMLANFLKLNDAKTEFLVFGSPHQCSKLPDNISITIGNSSIPRGLSARNIGAIFDSTLQMKEHVNSICRSCYVYIRNIGKIRKYLTQEATEKLIHAFISSKIDYLNSLLTGLPDYLTARLQKIQNNAARIVTKSTKHDNITPILKKLHWLPVEYRIKYKMALFTFKCLHNLAPSYLADLLTVYDPPRRLRSSDEHLLCETRVRTVHYGERAFSHAAPKIWNSLPKQIRTCDKIDNFKSTLKTHYFTEAFC